MRQLLPGPLTAARAFTRDETLSVYAEAYDNRRTRAARAVTLTIELRAEDGRILQTISEERSSRELDGRTEGYGFGAHVPLAHAAPGLYVIHVEARPAAAGQPAVSRDVRIRVR